MSSSCRCVHKSTVQVTHADSGEFGLFFLREEGHIFDEESSVPLISSMAATRNNKLGENTCVDDTAAHLMSAHLMHCSIGLQGVFFNKMKMFSYHSLGNVNKAHGL